MSEDETEVKEDEHFYHKLVSNVRMFALQRVTDSFFCDLSAPQLSYCHILYLSYLLAK